jgi:large subunit ribosomal protein L30
LADFGETMKKIVVRQVKSDIARTPEVRQTLRALGLGRIGKTKSLPENPEVLGMIKRVKYLLEVQVDK